MQLIPHWKKKWEDHVFDLTYQKLPNGSIKQIEGREYPMCRLDRDYKRYQLFQEEPAYRFFRIGLIVSGLCFLLGICDLIGAGLGCLALMVAVLFRVFLFLEYPWEISRSVSGSSSLCVLMDPEQGIWMERSVRKRKGRKGNPFPGQPDPWSPSFTGECDAQETVWIRSKSIRVPERRIKK